MGMLSQESQWILLSVSSGACAALNGVFAKLTTTELTAQLVNDFAQVINLENLRTEIETLVRIVPSNLLLYRYVTDQVKQIFFALNLILNGIMWALFTRALARGTSTTQVSILNTSANFIITAVLGSIIFNEKLPPLWFGGSAFLVAGNVIIGSRGGEEQTETNFCGDIEQENLITNIELELEEENKHEEEDDILHLDLEERSDTDRISL